jgi:hypothetical protein
MSDPHDREPVDQATIDCWRANYGLDKRTPAEAAKWWSDSMRGLAPSGCVAALGVALEELAALRKDAERYSWLRHRAPFGPTRRPVVWMTVSHGENLPDTHETWLDDDELDDAVDAAMAAEPAVGAA